MHVEIDTTLGGGRFENGQELSADIPSTELFFLDRNAMSDLIFAIRRLVQVGNHFRLLEWVTVPEHQQILYQFEQEISM